MPSLHEKLWAVILAGGNGTRLRLLTERISGDARPKQFCSLLGETTFLTQTRRRAELLISPERTLIVVSRSHSSYYEPLLADAPPGSILVQPEEHGTGAGILLPLLRISVVEPLAMVALFPSDHYVSDDAACMRYVLAAANAVASRPDLTVLLGVRPLDADPGYGWIEPGPPLSCSIGEPLYYVRRFWEKPSAEVARLLYARNCLWNSFLVVGHVATLLALIQHRAPTLHAALAVSRPALGTPREQEVLEGVYSGLPRIDFSKVLLEGQPKNLVVLPMEGYLWSDWGEPARIANTLRRIGQWPAWAGGLSGLSASR